MGPFIFKVGSPCPSRQGRAFLDFKAHDFQVRQVLRVRSGLIGFKRGIQVRLVEVGTVRIQRGVAWSIGSGRARLVLKRGIQVHRVGVGPVQFQGGVPRFIGSGQSCSVSKWGS